MYSNYLVYNILREAGLPDGVIQFIPGDAELVTNNTFNHPEFAGLHFTGSTHVFKMLWKKIGDNLDSYKSYPRIGNLGFLTLKLEKLVERICILFFLVLMLNMQLYKH